MLQMAEPTTDRRTEPRPTPDRRRGPREHVAPTLAEMSRPTGRPLRLRDLVALTGWSKPKLLADIECGYLKAQKVRCRDAFVWVVLYDDAQTYLKSIGVIQ